MGDPRHDGRHAAPRVPRAHLLGGGVQALGGRSRFGLCLLGYIGKCSAPCVKRIGEEDHRALAEDFCDFMAGQTSQVRQPPRGGDEAGGAGGRVRAGGQAPRRPAGAGTRHREAGRGARRRHGLRRHRAGGGPAGGGGPGVLRARRPGLAASAATRCWTRWKKHDARRNSVEHFLGQVTAETPDEGRGGQQPADPPRGPGPRAAARPERDDAVAGRTPRRPRLGLRVPRRGDKKALLETVARNCARAEDAGPAQDPARQRPDHAEQGRWPRSRTGSAWTTRRCASSATTCPT